MKTCKYCGELKKIMLFPKRSTGKPSAKCKVCTSIEKKKKYESEKDKISARHKSYYAKNAEKVKATVNLYRLSNLEVIAERKAQYYQANKEAIINRLSKKNADNPSIRAAYRAKNKASISSYMEVWQRSNPLKRRANESMRRSRTIGKYSQDAVERLLSMQAGKCPVCKNKLNDVYDVDHVIPLSKGGLNCDSNIQLLCPTCNRKKHAKDPVAFMQAMGYLI